MKCKECGKETKVKIKEATILIRDATRDLAVEIVVDDICLDCLSGALKTK